MSWPARDMVKFHIRAPSWASAPPARPPWEPTMTPGYVVAFGNFQVPRWRNPFSRCEDPVLTRGFPSCMRC